MLAFSPDYEFLKGRGCVFKSLVLHVFGSEHRAWQMLSDLCEVFCHCFEDRDSRIASVNGRRCCHHTIEVTDKQTQRIPTNEQEKRRKGDS